MVISVAVVFWFLLLCSTPQAFVPFATSCRRMALHEHCMSRWDTTTTQLPTLGLLTFDLDDTLFPIGPVVEDANEAMVKAMHRLGYKKSTNDSILNHTSKIRKQTKFPITYTELRKRAIQQELDQQASNIDESVAQHCFDAWLGARQKSADRYLFSDAVTMLEDVSELYPYACIGAITNGRGNPNGIDSLEPFFDFCVSGEDDHVFPERKPRQGIYEASLAVYDERYPHTISDSHVWIHVGDCLANDVGGSAKCGAYAVWKAPQHEESSSAPPDATDDKQPKWSTASKRTVQNRLRLANQAKGMMSAKVTRLSELPSVISEILELAAARQQPLPVSR